MPNFNKVFLMGHLTRNPELRYTPAGLGVVSFGLAVNTQITKDKQDTLFVDITAFGKQAEAINEYCQSPLNKLRGLSREGRG